MINGHVTVYHSIIINVTWRHLDQSAKQLIVGHTTKSIDGLACFLVSAERAVSANWHCAIIIVIDVSVHRMSNRWMLVCAWLCAYVYAPDWDACEYSIYIHCREFTIITRFYYGMRHRRKSLWLYMDLYVTVSCAVLLIIVNMTTRILRTVPARSSCRGRVPKLYVC